MRRNGLRSLHISLAEYTVLVGGYIKKGWEKMGDKWRRSQDL